MYKTKNTNEPHQQTTTTKQQALDLGQVHKNAVGMESFVSPENDVAVEGNNSPPSASIILTTKIDMIL